MNKQILDAKEKGYKILGICLPLSWDTIYKRFFLSWIRFMSQETYAYLEKIKVLPVINISHDFPLHYNRTKAVDDCITEYGADYILTLDADMTYPKDLLGLMLHGLTDDWPVKVGIYHKKADGHIPVLGKFSAWDDELESLRPWLEKYGYILPNGRQCLYYKPILFWDDIIPFEVDTGGTGCMIAKAEVFSKIKKPYFNFGPDPRSKDDAYPSVGSDLWFFSQLKKAGIPVLCDPRVRCGHISPVEIGLGHYEASRAKQVDSLTQTAEQFGLDVREDQKKWKDKWLIQL